MKRTILATVLALVLGLAGAALAADPILTLSGSAGKPLAAPRVTFNTIDRLYLAVYEFHYGATDWDIDGRIVDPTGQLAGDGTLSGDPVQISNPGMHSFECAVASAGSQFVVVWREQPAGRLRALASARSSR